MSDQSEAEVLIHLFDAAVQFTSESPADAVVAPDGREGLYLGSGDGIAAGERIHGRFRSRPLYDQKPGDVPVGFAR